MSQTSGPNTVGKKIRWWLIYGPVRTGTSLMLELVARRSRKFISDWGLENTLRLAPVFDHIRFDRERALRDISENLLANALDNRGTDLDLAFKQTNLRASEYEALAAMWGTPERVIFCFRQPAPYMASAIAKFSSVDRYDLQHAYIENIATFHILGGDPFEYHAGLTKADYERFLSPLDLHEAHWDFEHKGKELPDSVSPLMQHAYELMRQKAERGSATQTAR